MVQVISLTDTKELTPQKIKDVKVDSNVDFLELLMNDIKSDNKEKNLSDKSRNDKEEKNSIDLELDDKISLKDIENNKNFKMLMNEPEIKEETIKEIKNILDSKMKQQNILLSKQEIKEFKSIDNLKDLIKFADKKGLNIEKIKFEIPKDIKDKVVSNKDILEKKNKNDDKPIKETKITTKNVLEKKLNLNNQKIEKNKSDIKEPKTIPIHTKQIEKMKKTTISLEKILNKNENIKPVSKEMKETKKDFKVDTFQNLKSDENNNFKKNNNSKMDIKNVVFGNQTKEIKPKEINTKEIKIEKEIKTKEINLSDLLKPTIKEEKKVTIKHSENQNNSNINLSQTPVNEIKAKSVQARQTIESFKNNLDEAIKNYKPPISKVDIELNPKNLGKVEVSIIQRGNNIQVHMNTDQSNVALFQTHQAEFRQALANIGFSNIDMSFNSNQDRERKQNQAKKTYKENDSIEDIADIEIKASYRYA